MALVKIIHTADLHLGSSRTGVKNGKIEIENTFFKIINLCKTERVDFLLIAGDLFDSALVESNTAEKIISAMEQIPETVIAIAAGNHDPACPGSVYLKYNFPENVVIFQSFAEHFDFPEKSVRLWGAGFTDRFESIPLIQGFDVPSSDFINICVLHGDLVGGGSSSTYNPITSKQIEESGFDYLALGHIHKRSEIQKFGKTYFSYCGCPDGMGFDEAGSHGVYMGLIGKDICSLEYIETSSRQYVCEAIDISGCSDSFTAAGIVLATIQEAYDKDYSRNLYRITLTGIVPADSVIVPTQIQMILSDSLKFVLVYDRTEVDISDISKIAAETSLRGIFARKMLKRIDSADIEEKELYKNALKLGLQAFSKGVKLGDN